MRKDLRIKKIKAISALTNSFADGISYDEAMDEVVRICNVYFKNCDNFLIEIFKLYAGGLHHSMGMEYFLDLNIRNYGKQNKKNS